MTDLVYITGGKSFWDNNELRYSLRSMSKHLKNIGKVFVVGKCPDWLTNVVFIEAEDKFNRKKEPNLYAKRLIACRDSRITSDALFCYDDEYLLTDHDADNFPYYYEVSAGLYLKQMIGRKRKGHHLTCTENTVQALGAEAEMFDVHAPMRVNLEAFIYVMSLLDWSKPDGYLIKTAYANLKAISPTHCTDTKINHPDYNVNNYLEMIRGKSFFSTGDMMNFDELSKLMNILYPEPSIYERR